MLEQNDLVATLHLTSEEKRTGVVDGMKARKIVEKLKEKEYEQYMVDINRLEQSKRMSWPLQGMEGQRSGRGGSDYWLTAACGRDKGEKPALRTRWILG